MPKEIFKMSAKPENKKYTPEMRDCIEDFVNELETINFFYTKGDISKFNEHIKAYPLKTFEEYLVEDGNKYSEKIGDEYKYPIAKEKIKELNKYVALINSGTVKSIEELELIRKRVTEIKFE